MRTAIGAGVVAGLVAGVLWGGLLQVMWVPGPAGQQVPMMTFVAAAVGSERAAVGWGAHLALSVLLGAAFALLLGERGRRPADAVGCGLAWGLVLWLAGWLVLMPVRLGLPPLAPLRSLETLPEVIGALLGHVVFGSVLGGGIAWLRRERRAAAEAPGVRRAA
jgi:hypothetical protein